MKTHFKTHQVEPFYKNEKPV